MSYFSSLTQDVQTPAALQSTANINAGVTSTIGSASTLGVAAVQWTLFADQNCTVYLYESSDNVTWYLKASFVAYANRATGNTFQALMAYVQIRVKNNGLAATTLLELCTALCPIAEPLPQALSEEGNLKVGIYEIEDMNFQKLAWVSPMNALKVTESARLVGTALCDPLSTAFWTQATGGTGTITQTGGQVVLATGVLNGTSRLSTARIARYIGGYSNVFRSQIRRPAVIGANVQNWGSFDANNGAFFSMDNVAGLSVVTRKGGIDSPVPNGSFNGRLGASWVIDTLVHVYEIVYTNGTVFYLIDGVLLHRMSASAAPWTNTMHLNGAIENNNTANVNNNTLECRVLTVSRLGKESTQPTNQRITALTTTTLKNGPGLLHAIVFGDMPTAAAGTITIYDNTAAAGTIIAVLTPRRPNTTMQPTHVDFFKTTFSVGLTIVTAGNASDFTVIFE